MDILTQFIKQTIENYNKTDEKLNFFDFSRGVLTIALNELMDMQANMYIEELDAQRNGYRDFNYNTPVGTLTLKVPKLTNGSYHPDLITEKYNRCDQCLLTIAHELYVSGVSIRKLEKYFESLGVTDLKRSAISELMKKLDKEVADFNSADLSDIERPYLAFDATFMPCREEGSQALVTAITINSDGKREFVAERVVDTESYDSWSSFMEDLKARGLHGVKLVISDAHPGLKKAIRHTFIGAKWQRCIVHLERDVLKKCNRNKDRKAVAKILKAIFAEANPDVQRSLYHQTIEKITKINKSAGDILANAEGDALTYLDFPKSHWRKIRTNNIQERANRELQRRFKVVQIFPNIAAFERLAGAVVISVNESWGQRHYISVDKMLELNDQVKTNKTEEEKKAVEEAAKAKLTVIYNELVAEGLIAA